MSNQRGSLGIIIAIIVLMAAIAGGAYYLGTLNPPKSLEVIPEVTNNQPIPIPQITPPPATGSSSLKTYTSSDKSYSVQYPSDIYVRYICPGEELTLAKRGVEKEESVSRSTCARDFMYSIEIYTFGAIPEEPKTDEFYSVKSEPVIVSGISAKKYTIELIEGQFAPGGDYNQDIYVTYKDKTYQIHNGSKELQSTFDQIVSSFKFLN